MERKSIESEEFYHLMQIYRHTPIVEHEDVVKAYNAVKAHIETYANSRLEEAAQIFESLPPDGGRVKVEVVIESIRSLKSKEPV